MMYKFYIALTTLFLGFFLTPTASFACGDTSVKTENACCEKPAQKTKSDDCKNLADEDACGGTCKKDACQCTNFVQHFAVTAIANFKSPAYFFITKKIHGLKNENGFSSGFYFVWLPPKIS